VELSLLHHGFFLSGFHVNLCVSSGLISEIHPLILTITHNIWCVDNSLENYPQHLVLSLRSFWVYTRRSLSLSKPNPPQNSLALRIWLHQGRTSPRLQPLPLLLSRQKGKGKLLKSPSLQVVPNLFDVHISDAEDFHSSSASSRGPLQSRSNPDTPMSNSFRCFPACRSRWKSNKRRWVDSARRLP